MDQAAVDHFAYAAELLDVSSTIKAVRVAEQSEIIFASGEGGIIKSADGGEHWLPLHVNSNSRFFDLAISPCSESVTYTAGWNKSFDAPSTYIGVAIASLIPLIYLD